MSSKASLNLLEIVMKRQLEFMWDDEKQTEENEIYQEIFDEWFFNRLKKTADQVTERDVVGLTQFLRNYEISIDSLVATLLEYPVLEQDRESMLIFIMISTLYSLKGFRIAFWITLKKKNWKMR